MKCLLIFYVLYDGPDGECEEFGIEKEFDFAIRPMIGDELTVCGDSPFHVAAVAYDVDEATIEVRFNRGPRIESVQRWIDSGFSLHDIGGSVPSHLVW